MNATMSKSPRRENAASSCAVEPANCRHHAWIFASDTACVRDVMVGGRWRIRERRHADEERLARRFREAQAALLA